MIEEATRALIKLFRTIEPNTVLGNAPLTELAQLPAIVLNGPVAVIKKPLTNDNNRITAYDRENYIAVDEVAPRWYDLNFSVAIACNSALELVKLMEECSRLSQRARVIEAVSEERKRIYSWSWRNLPSMYNVPDISEVCEGRGELVIHDVEAYSNIRETIPLIREFILDARSES